MRDSKTELESKIRRSLRRSEGSERLLHGTQAGKFARATGARLQVVGDLLHLASTDGAVEVGRERRLALLTDLCAHRVTTSLDVSTGGYDASLVGGITLSILRSVRKADRPRVSLDFTVPRITLRI